MSARRFRVSLRSILCAGAVLVLVSAGCGGNKRAAVQGLCAPETSLSPGYSSGGSGGLQAADEPASQSLDPALAELDALEAPDGVDPALFAELKGALKEALTCRYSIEVSRVRGRD